MSSILILPNSLKNRRSFDAPKFRQRMKVIKTACTYSQYITILMIEVSKVIKFNNKGKDFFKEAKKQASFGPFSHFWITKRDFRDMIPRPHMIAYLTLVQHYDKVNCNGTNLLLPDKSGPSSWAYPNSYRPSIYDWVENTWDIKCENVFAGDLGEPVCF
jgi:hypothetical protein